jgi:hypothetical protein
MDLSQVINAGAVVVLVIVTAIYTIKTHTIASAAKRQANAAESTLGELRKRISEQQEIGRMIVANATQSALARIVFWEKEIVGLANRHALPSTVGLVPDQAGSALEHASRISKEAAENLRAAFDALTAAQVYIEVLRDGKNTSGDFYERYSAEVRKHLATAKKEIGSAASKLTSA